MADDQNSDAMRMLQYLPLMNSGQKIAFYPEVFGVGHNSFAFLDRNRTHFTLKNTTTAEECYVPYAAIEFITPSESGTIIRLRREMKLEHGTLL